MNKEFEAAMKAFLVHAKKLIGECRVYGGNDNELLLHFNSKRYIKANSWSTPHKTPRGNIFTPDDYGVEWHGAKYLKHT